MRMIPNWRFPEASERELSRSLQEATRDSVIYMRDRLDGLKFDATDEELARAEEDVESHIIEIFMAVAAGLFSIGRTIYRFNSTQWLAIAIASGGKENNAVMMLDRFGAAGMEPWYQDKLNLWKGSAENSVVKLARDIASDWSTNVRTLAIKGSSRKEVDAVIEKRYAIYGSWSKNRASGIIGTFNSMLMKQRLVDAGVTHYIWRGKMDERERQSHILLEGVKRALNGAGIFPGEEYNCRCWAVPYWNKEKLNNGKTTL